MERCSEDRCSQLVWIVALSWYGFTAHCFQLERSLSASWYGALLAGCEIVPLSWYKVSALSGGG